MVLSSDCEGLVLSAVTVGGDGDLGCMLEAAVVVVIGFSCWYGNADLLQSISYAVSVSTLTSMAETNIFDILSPAYA